MAGIHVLLDSFKGGKKLENTSTPREKDVKDSPGNAAEVFAAMLSGSMNLNANPKGQNSTSAGQDMEGTQKTDDSVPSVQNPNEKGSRQGYGNFVLSLFAQPVQSDIPAGKEANSGDGKSKGTESLVSANSIMTNATVVADKGLELAMLKLVSLASDEVSAQSGMTTPNPQGETPKIMELDKYRQLIAGLLEELSGEITNKSPKGTLLSAESSGSKDLSQDMAKIVQGWMTETAEGSKGGQASGGNSSGNVTGVVNDEQKTATSSLLAVKVLNLLEALAGKTGETGESAVSFSKGNSISSENTGVKDLRLDLAKIVQGLMTLDGNEGNNDQASKVQKGMQQLMDVLTAGKSTVNPELNAKVSTLLAALYPILNQEVKDVKASKGLEETFQANGDILDSDSMAKGQSEAIKTRLTEPKGMENALKPSVTATKDIANLSNPQQKSAEGDLQQNQIVKNVQEVFNEEAHKDDTTKSSESSAGKDVQIQNVNTNLGVVNNLGAVNVSDGKIVVTPVWEQIYTAFREQVLNKHQDLKELDIQLHPADLGKIQISMRWENGQVNLVVHASEAATGQILQNQLSDLRQNLTNQGVNCGMLQMGQGGEGQQNPHERESQSTFKQTIHKEDEDQIPIINSLSMEQDKINRINVIA